MTPTEALERVKRYPCDIIPAIRALGDAADPDDPALRELCARVAACAPSQQAFEDLMGDRAALMADFYPTPQEPSPTTDDTISEFLSKFGPGDPHESAALEKLIFNPMPDYAARLAAEQLSSPPPSDAADASEQDRMINAFIRAAAEPQTTPPPPAEQDISAVTPHLPETPDAPSSATAEGGTLTESFVRVLIQNRNYTKALEIISEINLNNPEKSVYFADQIRFLKKLIINEKKQ